MAVSQSELARHWGISRPAVKKRILQGCPTNSVRAAELWWEKRVHKRAPTTGPNVGKFAVPDNGTDSPEFIEGGKRGPGRPMKVIAPADTGDSLQDALKDSIGVERQAFKMLQRAMVNQSTSISAMLHVHTKAVQARLDVEVRVREEQERRGILVEKAVMTDMVRRTFEPVIRRLRKLPPERGPECSGVDPLQSTKILQREVDNVLSVMHKALKDFEAEKKKSDDGAGES